MKREGCEKERQWAREGGRKEGRGRGNRKKNDWSRDDVKLVLRGLPTSVRVVPLSTPDIFRLSRRSIPTISYAASTIAARVIREM